MHRAVLENIQSRRSVRQFNGKDLSKADIRTILQAANYAPSAHNQQSWRFIVVSGKKKGAGTSGQSEISLEVKVKYM